MEATDRTTEIIATLSDGLARIGYVGQLLERDYSFPDWFAQKELRTLDLAAFGQTPVSYESACIGVARTNGLREQALVNSLRAFAAPVLLEVDRSEVREWEVSRVRDQHVLVGRYRATELPAVLVDRAPSWQPKALLRSKNIGIDPGLPLQRSLFSGLIPGLEGEIQEKLDPLLRSALAATRSSYRKSTGHNPDARALFRLVFLALTAKVFADRRVARFTGTGDPDAILTAAAKYDGQSARLLNRQARTAAVEAVWADLDFRNLSVEVLADIWSRTLVDEETKKELGIHRTPRSIVRYLIKHVMPSVSGGDEDRIIFEPCSGSATFLIGALNYLRNSLPFSSGETRHKYFVKTLHGFEKDPFAVELSGLALTLADFPNRNDWSITEGDVFQPGAMTSYLRKSSVVLCNPPFGKFSSKERQKYGAVHTRKPGELIRRVLADLHPNGVLGFVLPYVFVDGVEYRDTRELLAERFASVDVTVLPEKSFAGAPTDIALVIARDPILHDAVKLSFRKVHDSPEAWRVFQENEAASTDREALVDIASVRSNGFVLPELEEVWTRLNGLPTLGDIADVHRGIEWRSPVGSLRHVRSTPAEGYRLGVAPQTQFFAFEVPRLQYLDVRPDDQLYSAASLPWSQPKAILRKSRVSRGNWRLVAFPDSIGACCYQTYHGVWPRKSATSFDEVVLAAVLNGPLANAFVATHKGARDITVGILRKLPMPFLSAEKQALIRDLVLRYQTATGSMQLERIEDPEFLLKRIDATVLEGYRLPPRLEKQVLDFFQGDTRKVAHPFSDYFPAEFDLFVSLSQYLRPDFQNATVENMLARSGTE